MTTRPYGFTLIELMVTISIIGILAVIVYANVGAANPKARDAERQTDLRNLQIAIEKYKQKNGRYPAMGTDSDADGLAEETENSGVFVVGLAPEFITVLPKDPRRGTATGYAYVTNAEGTSYKILAIDTVESETVTESHPMKRCENSSANICSAAGVCNPANGGYQNTYALWGGYAEGASNNSRTEVIRATRAVICL